MNWKRSFFFRIWIVLSVLWVAAIGWLLNPVQKIHEIRSPVLFQIGDYVVQYPSGTETEIVRHTLTDLIRTEAAKKAAPAWALLDDVDATVNKAIGDYRSVSLWVALCPIGGLIFLPPIVLLAAGFTAIWIARGFSTRR